MAEGLEPRVTRGGPVPTVRQLQDDVDTAYKVLREQLNREIRREDIDRDSLKLTARESKNAFFTYEERCSALAMKLKRDGSWEEYRELLQEKLRLGDVMRDYLSLINGLLRDLNATIVSTFSQHSLHDLSLTSSFGGRTERSAPPPKLSRSRTSTPVPEEKPEGTPPLHNQELPHRVSVPPTNNAVQNEENSDDSRSSVDDSQIYDNSLDNSSQLTNTQSSQTEEESSAANVSELLRYNTSSSEEENKPPAPRKHSAPRHGPVNRQQPTHNSPPARNTPAAAATVTTPADDSQSCKRKNPTTAELFVQQDILKTSIDPFDGEPSYFWPWKNQMEHFLDTFNLSPALSLQSMLKYTTGNPKEMIKQRIETVEKPTNKLLELVWKDLTRRYGALDKVASGLQTKLQHFPVLPKGSGLADQLYSLVNICRRVQFNMKKCHELKIFNYSSGIKVILEKLPEFIVHEWGRLGRKYEKKYKKSHPPFKFFVDYLLRKADEIVDEKYSVKRATSSTDKKKHDEYHQKSTTIKVMQTQITSTANPHITSDGKPFCVIHQKPGHKLINCNAFKYKTYEQKYDILKSNKLCYKCAEKHYAKACDSHEKCATCSKPHLTILHCKQGEGIFKKKPETSSMSKISTGGSGYQRGHPPAMEPHLYLGNSSVLAQTPLPGLSTHNTHTFQTGLTPYMGTTSQTGTPITTWSSLNPNAPPHMPHSAAK